MTLNINELRQLAQAATPGPWVSHGRYIGTPRHMSYIGEVRDQCGNWSDTEKSRADAAFISAANPTAISELLDRLEAAERERDFAKTEIARLHDDIRELTDVRVLDEEDRDRIAWLQGTSTKPAPGVPSFEVELWRQNVLGLVKQYGNECATEAYHGDLHCREAPKDVFAEIEMALYALPGAKGEKDV